jgi:lysylphosphatidylglycerol synthetase-like protein (DUF2156 family)
LQTVIHKLTQAGYDARLYQPPISDALLQELRVFSDEWLAHMQVSEKKFLGLI